MDTDIFHIRVHRCLSVFIMWRIGRAFAGGPWRNLCACFFNLRKQRFFYAGAIVYFVEDGFNIGHKIDETSDGSAAIFRAAAAVGDIALLRACADVAFKAMAAMPAALRCASIAPDVFGRDV